MTEAASSGAATGAMSGLRVIDLTRVLGGPYCTQILADHGADVIKVEPPAGDEVRDWGPPFHEEDAAYFIGINRNKRSIGLDLASEGGRHRAAQDAGKRRRPDRKLQAGHAGEMGHRQRGAAREIPAPGALPDLRLRCRRPARRQSRL
ncbi:crotonobetainyl-CoA:carnitine CoA-transferase CaiB-like acyl-CoA transferase [Bradyrhizobium sp. LM6.11]